MTGSITLTGLVLTTIFFFFGARQTLVPGVISLVIFDSVLNGLKAGLLFLFISAVSSFLSVVTGAKRMKAIYFLSSIIFGLITFAIIGFVVGFILV